MKDEREPELHLMSFNLRNMRAKDGPNGWDLRREFLFEIVRRNRPDVIATQEGYLPQIEQMREALPEYATVGGGREDGKTEGEFCALFFLRDRFRAEAQGTFWFSETPETPGSRHWTRAHARICTWARLLDPSGQAFLVYNVHLDHESQSARERSVQLLLETVSGLADPDPALLAGDFNMEEDNPAIRRLTTAAPRVFRDTFRVVHPDEKRCGTFHGFTGTEEGERIDFIFASPEFRIMDARILHDNREGRYPSDHFPITTQVRLKS